MYLLVFLLLQGSNFQMEQYYIYFERSGGFAGITQTLELKSDTLSVEDQDHLRTLIDASGFFDIESEKDSGMPDQFNYKLTVKYKGKEKTLELEESGITDSLRPLITYLSRKARSR